MFLRLILSLSFCITIQTAHAQTYESPSSTMFARFSRDMSVREANVKVQATGLKVSYKSQLVPGLFILKPRVNEFNMQSALRASRLIDELVYFEQDRSYRRPPQEGVKKFFKNFKSSLTQLVPPSYLPKDPLLEDQWALHSPFGINPNLAWNITRGDPRVIVAVIDTGMQYDLPDLKGHLLPGFDFILNHPEMKEYNGHGTFVAGLIASQWNDIGIAGVAPGVSLLPLRVIPEDRDEKDEHVIKAIEYAVKRGARIANCSFMKPSSSHAVGEVIEASGRQGLLMVAIAGNGGEDHRGDDNNIKMQLPANFRTSNMIVVAASNQSGFLTEFSNYGLRKVDIAAPGVDIRSSFIYENKVDYFTSWGTSFAAPHVAATAALMLSINPKLSAYDLKRIILSTGRRVPSLQPYINTGSILDTSAAVLAAAKLR